MFYIVIFRLLLVSAHGAFY